MKDTHLHTKERKIFLDSLYLELRVFKYLDSQDFKSTLNPFSRQDQKISKILSDAKNSVKMKSDYQTLYNHYYDTIKSLEGVDSKRFKNILHRGSPEAFSVSNEKLTYQKNPVDEFSDQDELLLQTLFLEKCLDQLDRPDLYKGGRLSTKYKKVQAIKKKLSRVLSKDTVQRYSVLRSLKSENFLREHGFIEKLNEAASAFKPDWFNMDFNIVADGVQVEVNIEGAASKNEIKNQSISLLKKDIMRLYNVIFSVEDELNEVQDQRRTAVMHQIIKDVKKTREAQKEILPTLQDLEETYRSVYGKLIELKKASDSLGEKSPIKEKLESLLLRRDIDYVCDVMTSIKNHDQDLPNEKAEMMREMESILDSEDASHSTLKKTYHSAYNLLLDIDQTLNEQSPSKEKFDVLRLQKNIEYLYEKNVSRFERMINKKIQGIEFKINKMNSAKKRIDDLELNDSNQNNLPDVATLQEVYIEIHIDLNMGVIKVKNRNNTSEVAEILKNLPSTDDVKKLNDRDLDHVKKGADAQLVTSEAQKEMVTHLKNLKRVIEQVEKQLNLDGEKKDLEIAVLMLDTLKQSRDKFQSTPPSLVKMQDKDDNFFEILERLSQEYLDGDSLVIPEPATPRSPVEPYPGDAQQFAEEDLDSDEESSGSDNDMPELGSAEKSNTKSPRVDHTGPSNKDSDSDDDMPELRVIKESNMNPPRKDHTRPTNTHSGLEDDVQEPETPPPPSETYPGDAQQEEDSDHDMPELRGTEESDKDGAKDDLNPEAPMPSSKVSSALRNALIAMAVFGSAVIIASVTTAFLVPGATAIFSDLLGDGLLPYIGVTALAAVLVSSIAFMIGYAATQENAETGEKKEHGDVDVTVVDSPRSSQGLGGDQSSPQREISEEEVSDSDPESYLESDSELSI